MAVGPQGEIYVTEEADCFSGGPCSNPVYLKRYHPDGSLDRSFGGGRVLVSTEGRSGVLAVDSAGRPVIVFARKDGLDALRFLPDGSPDLGFGQAGHSSISCDCGLSSLEVGPGDSLLLTGSAEFKRPGPFRGVIWVIVRLRSDGALDSSFAQDGLLRVPRPGYYDAAASIGDGGETTLYGFHCCRSLEVPFVVRMSADGSLDRRYAVATSRSLHGLPGTRKRYLSWERVLIVQQAHGGVELFASREGLEGELQGLAVKLRANGRRDPSFGKEGVERFGFEVADATVDGAGGTLLAAAVLGRRYHRGYRVMRVLRDGRIDPKFGRVALPGARNDGGIAILPQGRGAAIVYDQGIPSCRQTCEDDPKMYRVETASH